MNQKTDFFRQSNNKLGMRNFYYSEQSFDTPYSMPHPHIHNQHELYLLLSGARKYNIGARIIHIHAGDLVFIPKNTIHRTENLRQAGHSRMLINFSDEYFSNELYNDFSSLFRSSVLSLSTEAAETVKMLMEKIGLEYMHPHDNYSELALRNSVDTLLIYLLRADLTDSGNNSSKPDSFIDKAVSYTNANFDMPITLSEMAKITAMSKSHFSKCFRESTGLSFGEYLNMTRILNAQRLLHDTDMSVTQIASACGFNDSSYFSTAFRKQTGMTPLNFRKSKTSEV